MTPKDLQSITDKVEKAQIELHRLCEGFWLGKNPWKWQIPANPQEDSDLIIGDGLRANLQLLDQLAERDRKIDELERMNFRDSGGIRMVFRQYACDENWNVGEEIRSEEDMKK